MTFVNFEHHGYFHGVVSAEGDISYRLGRKSTSCTNLWNMGHISRDTCNEVSIKLENPVNLAEHLPKIRESRDAINALSNLGPLSFWMQEKTELLNQISPHILTNRGTLKILCSREWENSFHAKMDDKGRIILYKVWDKNDEEDLTGFALEKFITHGLDDSTYDYREKMYSMQCLQMGDRKILYNAEFDGFINIPITFRSDCRGFQFAKAVPCEIKLWNGAAGFENKLPQPWRLKSWFNQCLLAGIEDIIVGVNPYSKRDYGPPTLTGVRVYKTADLPHLCKNDLYTSMWNNLTQVLQYIDNINFKEGIFKITISKNGSIRHEIANV